MTDNPTTASIPSPPENDDAFAPAHEVTASNSSTGMFELADRILSWRGYKDTLAALTKDANEVIAKIESALVEQMVEDEVQRFTRGPQTFYLKTATNASVRAGQKDALVDWLNENGHGSLVGTAVNAMSLTSFVKELMDDEDNTAGALPYELTELVNVWRRPAISMRKA